MGGSLRRRLLALIACAALPLVIVAGWAGLHDAAQHSREAEENVSRIARDVAHDVDRMAASVHGILSMLGQLVEPDAQSWDKNGRALRAANAELPAFFSSLNLFGPDGELWATSMQPPPPVSRRHAGDRLYFREVKRTAAFAAGEPVVSRGTGNWTVSLALPLLDDNGDIRAVVTAALALDRLQAEILRDIDLPEASTVALVSGSGRILARTLDPDEWIGQDMTGRGNYEHARALGVGREVFVAIDGVERLSAFHEARRVPWLVYVGMPTHAVYAEQQRRLLMFAIAVVLALGLSGLVSWRLARSIRRSVVAVQQGADVLATGSFGHRIAFDGARELEDLATSINAMAEALEQRERALEAGRIENESSRARLQAIFEAEPAMVVITAGDGRIDLMNAAGLELCGAGNIDEVTGRSLLAMIDGADRERFEAHFTRALSGARESVQFAIVDLAGNVRTMFGVGGALRLERGGWLETGYIGVIRDVTEEREAEVVHRQAQRLAAIGELTGGIAHDFNNLLTVIVGALEMLEPAAQSDPAVSRSVALARRSTDRATELTRRLLAFARRQPLEPRVIDVNALVRGSVGLLRGTLGEDIEIETVLAAGIWLVLADPGQLENAVINLSVNARDAMPGGGKLTIETSNARLDEDYARAHDDVRPGQYVLIAVSDTGVGMTPDLIERAFEPFFTTKAVGSGTGLGLSMVHGFVKQSGGHVKIYSEPGSGTTVKLYLPRSHAAGPGNSVEATPEVPLGRGETVLVVEDDADVRDLVVASLEFLNYHAVVVQDGPAALEVLRGDLAVDVLFTDVVLPGGMNGREVARRARELRPGLPLLFTSGYTENAIIHQGRVDPDVLLLPKPWRRDELARRLRDALERRD
ncbi:MAG: ATP-binding protein [Pseudomonadota bacterium]|nr:ATP-binding protein [Pseudomonadota bacterium]